MAVRAGATGAIQAVSMERSQFTQAEKRVVEGDVEEEQHAREEQDDVEDGVDARLILGRLPEAVEEIGADVDAAHQGVAGAEHEESAPASMREVS